MSLHWEQIFILHTFRCNVCGVTASLDIVEGTSIGTLDCCDHAEDVIRAELGLEPAHRNGSSSDVSTRTYVRYVPSSNGKRGGNDVTNAPEAKSGKVKTATIIINGQPKVVDEKDISFEELAEVAFDGNPPTGPNIVITITYGKGEHGKQGSLLPGQTVHVKDGMVFNVTATDKS